MDFTGDTRAIPPRRRVRRLVTGACLAATLGALAPVAVSRVESASEGECHARGKKHADCGVHNMMVVGEGSIFLSHLPMFDGEHRFQVILEATFSRRGTSLGDVYAGDRRSHPGVRMYTLAPRDMFVLARLFGTDPPPLRAFRATVFRGHLERGGEPIERLTDVDVTITRVVYRQEIGAAPGVARPDKLDYVLFGVPGELYLAHRITQPPDFDQLIGVKVTGHTFTGTELERGVSVKILDRENLPARRLRVGDKVAAQGQVTGANMFLPIVVEVATEYYFEDGELSSPAVFEPTPLEKAAGF